MGATHPNNRNLSPVKIVKEERIEQKILILRMCDTAFRTHAVPVIKKWEERATSDPQAKRRYPKGGTGKRAGARYERQEKV